MPYYLCNVMRLSALKENCKILYYHIDDNFMPAIEFPKDSYVLYPNYFGICDDNVKKLADKYSKLIVDNAHSFYSEPIGFACFNSARKFLPVYNGSLLWIQNADLNFDYDENIYKLPANEEEKSECEYEFNYSDIKFLKKDFIANKENIEKRKSKFIKYHEKYWNSNLLNINIDSCFSPFCYPYLADTENEANAVVKTLQQDGLIIYRYWNNLPKDYNEYKFYSRLIPIPLE